MGFPIPQAYLAAEGLEQALGDPRTGARAFSFERSLVLDEAEAFPEAQVAELGRAGYLRHLVPEAEGGALRHFEEALALQRAVARRDLTVAIAVGQGFLGALPVWLRGTAAQRAAMASRLLGGEPVALALTEEAHGGDLLAGELSAERDGDGWVLRGRKWLINNGARATVLTVLARTQASGGLGGFSLLGVERAQVGAVERLRTHGIRGADISGVAFDGARVPGSAVIGRVGGGVEAVFEALQLSRIGCTSFSLGAADTALRATLGFARGRALFGASVLSLPQAASALTDAFVDLLACDAVATACARGVHAAPEQTALASAVAKAFVPTQVEALLGALSRVLGARHFLRQGPQAAFQKVLRDHAVVPLFDGSTAVNLDALAHQLPRLGGAATAAPHLAFALQGPLPLLDWSRPAPALGRDDVTQTIPALAAALAAAPADADVRAALVRWGRALSDAHAQLHAEVGARVAADRGALRRSAEGFACARRFAALWAAAACGHLWLHSRDALGPFFARGAWLVAALERLLAPDAPPTEGALRAEVLAHLLALDDAQRLFALVPIQLGS
jgi:alkylation response protein AidB-like acyl-CoA dehydrogenase